MRGGGETSAWPSKQEVNSVAELLTFLPDGRTMITVEQDGVRTDERIRAGRWLLACLGACLLGRVYVRSGQLTCQDGSPDRSEDEDSQDPANDEGH